MFDTTKEDPISLSAAAKLLPRRRAGKKPHTSTLYRWASRGFRGIRLEVIRVGSTLCTSREALQRFFERITETDPHISARRPNRKNEQEQHEIESRLDELGVR